MQKKLQIEIKIDESKCTGCMICMLWCSYTNHKLFIPSKAYLKIKERYGLKPKIFFLDECLNCGQCAQHCLYGALNIKEGTN